MAPPARIAAAMIAAREELEAFESDRQLATTK
jgi:hypothetical protein